MTVPGDQPEPSLQEKVAALEKQLLELKQKCVHLIESAPKGPDADKAKPAETSSSKPEDGPKPDGALDGEKGETCPQPRVKIIKRAKDPETGERVERPEGAQPPKTEGNSDHAFVLKKTTQEPFPEEEDFSEIDIVNPALWDLLKKHLGDYPYHIFRGSPVTLSSPFEAIVFGWDALQAAAAEMPKDEKDERAREDLQLLLDIISGGASGDSKLDKYFKTREVCLNKKTVQFDDLWTIFPPGTLVYGRPFQNQDQLFIVQDNAGTWPDRENRPQKVCPWKLGCWTYDWKDDRFQRTPFTLIFEPYEGLRPITSLPYYPFELHPDQVAVSRSLKERGQKFKTLCLAKEGQRLFKYKGDAMFGKKGFSGLVQGDDDDSDIRSMPSHWELQRLRRQLSQIETVQPPTGKSSHTDSRVMIDYTSYVQYGPAVARNGALEPSKMDPDCMCSDCQRNEGLCAKYRTRFDGWDPRKAWEDEQYMLCPPRVLGYLLRDKQWAQLQVSLVEKIPTEDTGDAWKSRLRLADDNNTKDLLFDLVRSHVSSTPDSEARKAKERGLEVDDIIPGKGKGLVILLYGPPGVGKTSTAETIAVAARKPLFSISVADVGTRARHVESNLYQIFSLATRWQAILLIDEADVFLESRVRGAAASTERNALVSVFLRVLEYYQGIMFLTTNQIAQFDVAIPSRIHIAIQYQSLKPSQMEEIFKGFLQPLEDDGLVDDYEGILYWLKEDVYNIGFDGRQIRNIVTTALDLARAEVKYRQGKDKLSKKHLRSVVHNTRSFKTDFAVQYDRYLRSQEKLIR